MYFYKSVVICILSEISNLLKAKSIIVMSCFKKKVVLK